MICFRKCIYGQTQKYSLHITFLASFFNLAKKKGQKQRLPPWKNNWILCAVEAMLVNYNLNEHKLSILEQSNRPIEHLSKKKEHTTNWNWPDQAPSAWLLRLCVVVPASYNATAHVCMCVCALTLSHTSVHSSESQRSSIFCIRVSSISIGIFWLPVLCFYSYVSSVFRMCIHFCIYAHRHIWLCQRREENKNNGKKGKKT